MKIIKTEWGEIHYYTDKDGNQWRRIFRDGNVTVELLIKAVDGFDNNN